MTRLRRAVERGWVVTRRAWRRDMETARKVGREEGLAEGRREERARFQRLGCAPFSDLSARQFYVACAVSPNLIYYANDPVAMLKNISIEQAHVLFEAMRKELR